MADGATKERAQEEKRRKREALSLSLSLHGWLFLFFPSSSSSPGDPFEAKLIAHTYYIVHALLRWAFRSRKKGLKSCITYVVERFFMIELLYYKNTY